MPKGEHLKCPSTNFVSSGDNEKHSYISQEKYKDCKTDHFKKGKLLWEQYCWLIICTFSQDGRFNFILFNLYIYKKKKIHCAKCHQIPVEIENWPLSFSNFFQLIFFLSCCFFNVVLLVGIYPNQASLEKISFLNHLLFIPSTDICQYWPKKYSLKKSCTE